MKRYELVMYCVACLMAGLGAGEFFCAFVIPNERMLELYKATFGLVGSVLMLLVLFYFCPFWGSNGTNGKKSNAEGARKAKEKQEPQHP